MAVDTRNKRASCLGFGAPFRAVWPNPDGSLENQEDRQHVAYLYPGLAALPSSRYVEYISKTAVCHLTAPGVCVLQTIAGDNLTTLDGDQLIALQVIASSKTGRMYLTTSKQAIAHQAATKSAELE